jgi:hypothetical protein
MGTAWSVILNRKDGVSGLWKQWRTSAVYTGPASPGSIPMISASGMLDASLVPSSSGGNLRQPDTFKSGQASTSGSTAIWTPASGNKFRLLKYAIEGTLNLSQASQGVLTVSFMDGTSPMSFAHDVYVPSTAMKLNVLYNSGWIDLGSTGFLSVAANNVLNVNLSASLTAGNFRITVCGTEE